MDYTEVSALTDKPVRHAVSQRMCCKQIRWSVW